LVEYQEKRKLGSSYQEILLISKNLNKMLEFIKKDYEKLKKLHQAESLPRVFKWNRNEERIKFQKEDLEIIELHIKKVTKLISEKNETNTETKFKENFKNFENYENNEFPPIDISNSKTRLEESKRLWKEKMTQFKSQLVELGEKNLQIKDQLEFQIEKMENKLQVPLGEQIIKIQKINKDIDGAQKEIGRNWFRLIALLIIFFVLLILIIVMVVLLLKSGFF
jgi:hypothetical protein